MVARRCAVGSLLEQAHEAGEEILHRVDEEVFERIRDEIEEAAGADIFEAGTGENFHWSGQVGGYVVTKRRAKLASPGGDGRSLPQRHESKPARREFH